MKIQFLSPHLIVFESALFRTCTTLIIHDDHVVLVDPNWLPEEIEFIDLFIRRQAKNKKKYLFFTHSDYDHVVGYGRFKHYTSIASESFVTNKDKDQIIEQIRSFDDQYYIQRNYPIEYPIIDVRVKRNKDCISIGNNKYDFYQAPGHNADGLILHDPKTEILVVGDYLSNIEFPYIYQSFEKYETTLNTIENVINENPIKFMVTGHGDATNSKNEMHRRIKVARSYIQLVKTAITEEEDFDFEHLMRSYDFPIIMRKFHEANMLLAKQEFKTKTIT